MSMRDDFSQSTKEMLANNAYTGIATHDTRIIDAIYESSEAGREVRLD